MIAKLCTVLAITNRGVNTLNHNCLTKRCMESTPIIHRTFTDLRLFLSIVHP